MLTKYLIMIVILCAVAIGLHFKNQYQLTQFKKYCKEQIDKSNRDINTILANHKIIKRCNKCNSEGVAKCHDIFKEYGVFCKNDGCDNSKHYGLKGFKTEFDAIFNWNMEQDV